MSENENTEHVIDFSGDAESLRWVQKAQAKPKEGRPVLETVYVNSAIVAADGFRLHAAPTPKPLKSLRGRLLDFGKPVAAKSQLVKATEYDGIYPNVAQIIPKAEPVAEILIDPKFLVEALQGMTIARIAVQPGKFSPLEVFGKDKNGEPLYALIMCLHPEHTDATGLTWRPQKEDAKAE